MTSALPPLVQAVSGSIGSAAANALADPLDLISTRLQLTKSSALRGPRGIPRVLQHIVRSEGWRVLFDGLQPDTVAQLLSNFLYFYFYSTLRTFLVHRKTRSTAVHTTKTKSVPVLLNMFEEIGIGFAAGVASRAVTTPLSVITVQLQTATSADDNDDISADTKEAMRSGRVGVVDMLKDIYEEYGLSGFWSGFTTTVPLSLTPALTLFFFQLFRRIIARAKRGKSNVTNPTSSEAFFGAAFSNTAATVILYPLMLAKTRLQARRKEARKNDADSMLTIWKEAYYRGRWAAVYQGLEAQLLKGFVSQGTTMMIKQRLELSVVALYLRHVRYQV